MIDEGGYRMARDPFQHVAIGFETRPYSCASTTVLRVIRLPSTSRKFTIIEKNLSVDSNLEGRHCIVNHTPKKANICSDFYMYSGPS